LSWVQISLVGAQATLSKSPYVLAITLNLNLVVTQAAKDPDAVGDQDSAVKK